MTEKKFIFLDIDGTILVPGEGIRQCVKDGIRKARDNGNLVFLCTGRSHWNMPSDLKDMELDGMIASAGSDIWIHGENVYRTWLEPPTLATACESLNQIHAIYILEGFEHVYLSEEGRRILLKEELYADSTPELIRWKQLYRRRKNVKSMEEWDPQKAPMPKITFIVRDRESRDWIREKLGNILDVVLFPTESGNFFHGELLSLIHHKGEAIRRMVEFMKGTPGQVVAFGDSMNDYQMIGQAACGVAMGNGDEKLKSIAARVCEPVQEDGVIRELERMGII